MDTVASGKRSRLNQILFSGVLCITFAVSGCTARSDKPPKLDTPLPEAHFGIYVSEDARFSFKGDGKTVLVELSDRYLDVLENPPNDTEYLYTFTWYDFGEYRYDAATNLRLYHMETRTSINFSLYDTAAFERISLSFPLPDKAPQVLTRISDYR
jgi:hypothetical protein